MRGLAWIAALTLVFLAPVGPGAKAEGTVHRVAIHVDQDDPAVMTMALNNAENVAAYYEERGEKAQIEFVVNGPGLRMLRDDTSPVKDRIRRMAEERRAVVFSACAHTKAGMEKREGKPITIIPQAGIVPSGVVRLMQLQEQGWSYVRP